MGKYSCERNVQQLVSLMKQHGIKKIIVSPGMKNVPLISSVQFDSYFEVYSCVDERSAAYMACGLAVESGEPVALSCTGATASRNYISALTEAYYRNIPILAITSMSHQGEIGHLIPQIIDRNVPLNDMVKESVQINPIYTDTDEWDVNVKLNRAILELRRNGGGPVHINLISTNYTDFTSELTQARKITRYFYEDKLPEIKQPKVAVFIGAHKVFSAELTKAVDDFCGKYNGVVICDKTSNYYGEYCIWPSVLNAQVQGRSSIFNIELLIHIGDVSGSYIGINAKRVWRINRDGELRDTFKSLEAVFEMSEEAFFLHYSSGGGISDKSYLHEWINECESVNPESLELPFSNAWIAQQIGKKLPDNSVLFLGILNTLRSWNFFDVKKGIPCYSNTGGFGIDGMLSTAIGAAMADPYKICYIVLGDLSFFYDMNSIGNRHTPPNLRIILINNGKGIEFRNYRHPAENFGAEADPYMAAAGHFGDQSPELVKHYAADLGFRYYTASTKEEFLKLEGMLVSPDKTDSPALIEIFTTTEDESKALELISNIYKDKSIKQMAKRLLGENGTKNLKKILGRN